jgi:hypothetical protein
MVPRRDPDDPGAAPLAGPRGLTLPPSPEGFRYLVEVTRAEIDTQLDIAERTDAKARARFAIAAAIFIAAQMLVLCGNTLTSLGGGKTLLLDVAVIAGILVGLALMAIAVTTFARRDRRFESAPLRRWLGGLKELASSEAEISARIVQPYKALMRERQANGLARARRLRWIQALWLIATLVSLIELLAALQALA